MGRGVIVEQQKGLVVQWDDDRGFGFIGSQQGSVFLHISVFKGSRRPKVGDEVVFGHKLNTKGKLQATFARLNELEVDQESIRQKKKSKNRHAKQHRRSRYSQIGTREYLDILAIVICLVGLWQFYHGSSIWLVPAIYGVVSLVSIGQYSVDKRRAKSHEWRIPESYLHLIEWLGGWPGAIFAQIHFNHKTTKQSYQVVFQVIIIAHAAFWLDYLMGSNGLNWIKEQVFLKLNLL